MTYNTDERFDVWMKEIIEHAWDVIECYEEYLLDKKNSKQLSKTMKILYDKLPIDPDRKKKGKDSDKPKKDLM